MKVEEVGPGLVICADSTAQSTVDAVGRLVGGNVPLIVADPPYGNVVSDAWDQWTGDASSFVEWMLAWTRAWSTLLLPNAAFYVWGGVGSPGFRPFFRYLATVEEETELRIANLVTWKKRRGYGVQHNYLFTREELVYLINGKDVKRPRVFNVPLLEEVRGYPGFNKKYPAKSEFYRRSNVWTDVTEIMRGKVHEAQKPTRLAEIMIQVHTVHGEWVIDPFAGSGSTAFAAINTGRRFVVIERDESMFHAMVNRLRVNLQGSSVGSLHGPKQEATFDPSQAPDVDTATHRK